MRIKLLFAAVLRIAAKFSQLQLIDNCHGDSSMKGQDLLR